MEYPHIRKPISVIFSVLAVALLFGGCASSTPEQGPVSNDDILVNFLMRVQSQDYYQAMKMVSDEDRVRLVGPQNRVRPELEPGLRNIKLSTLQSQNIKIVNGKLVGIAHVVEQATASVATSEEQLQSLPLPASPSHDSEEGIGSSGSPSDRGAASAEPEEEPGVSAEPDEDEIEEGFDEL